MGKYDSFFTTLDNTSPYAKIAAQGSAGSGKTYTLALISVGLYQFIKSTKPIVIFDTERAAKFLKPFYAGHGIPVLLKESRTLNDLIATMEYCEAGNADILIIDSITHVWEGFLEAYKQKTGHKALQFQDWGHIKPTWKREYSDRLVMGRYHTFFTGREGYTYESEINQETNKREIYVSGVKMKVEGDTAYEPDVLIRMERFEEVLDKTNKKVWREATIIKDRSTLIDGQTFVNPTFDNFQPVIEFLLTDVSEPKETESRTDHELFEVEEDNRKAREAKTILLEKIGGVFALTGLGTGAADKKRKADITQRIFMTTSGKEIENMSIDQLSDALNRLENDREIAELITGKKL